MSLSRKQVATSIAVLACIFAAKSSANDLDRRAEIGFAIAEQQGIELDRDKPDEGLGSYLASASGCNDCHTWPNYAPGGNPFSRQTKQFNLTNFMAGGRMFTLPTENVCSRNISPAPGTHRPAGLSRAEFIYVLKTGCDPQDAHFLDPKQCGLLQVMPWPQYRDLKLQDLSAIYSFLSALPYAAPGAAKQCEPDPQGIAGE